MDNTLLHKLLKAIETPEGVMDTFTSYYFYQRMCECEYFDSTDFFDVIEKEYIEPSEPNYKHKEWIAENGSNWVSTFHLKEGIDVARFPYLLISTIFCDQSWEKLVVENVALCADIKRLNDVIKRAHKILDNEINK